MIDGSNRLKTLFDALPTTDELPPKETPNFSEDPFYCLLEDDALITRLNVESERMMEADAQRIPDGYVKLVVRVSVKARRLSYLTLPIGGDN